MEIKKKIKKIINLIHKDNELEQLNDLYIPDLCIPEREKNAPTKTKTKRK